MHEIDIPGSLAAIGIKRGDTVMIHGDSGVAAQLRSIQSNERVKHLIHEILSYIGPNGTVITPTFSYSFTKGEDFDSSTSPSSTGLFSEYFRKMPNVKRSNHPLFSVAAYGNAAIQFENSGITDCFGKETAFGLLITLDAKILCLGCNINRITFTHYVEQAYQVHYRSNKEFHGNLIKDGQTRPVTTSYYVRDLSIRSECELSLLKEVALKQGKLTIGNIGRFPLMAIRARDFFDIATQLLDRDPNALILEGVK